MGIRFLEYEEIDFGLWDKCISESFNGTIYAFSWYLDIVSPGWNALVEGNYDSVFPLPVRKKYLIEYVYLPFYCQQLGLISKSKIDSEKLNEFLEAIPRQFKWIEQNLNIHNKIEPNRYSSRKNINYELDLIQPYENLFSNYSKDHKKNLKIAANSKLMILKDLTNMDFINFYDKNLLGQLGQMPEDTKYLLLRLIAAAQRQRKGQLYGVYDERNQLVSVGFLLHGLGRIILLASASSSEGRAVSSMRFLIDRIISWNAGRNLILDFEGSNLPGIASFFAGFGSTPTNYYTIRINRLPFWLRWIKSNA